MPGGSWSAASRTARSPINCSPTWARGAPPWGPCHRSHTLAPWGPSDCRMNAAKSNPARKGGVKPPKAKPLKQQGQSRRRTAIITGITGQDGSYLAELLLDKGYEVVGVVRRTSHDSYERIGHLLDRVHIVPADLLDQHSLTSVVRDAKPDEVYNLAAQSFVPTSWSQPVLTGEFTALGVTRLLEAGRLAHPEARFHH